METRLVQGSPEWLEMRKSRIGASDAPIILGVSPYKTALQLWEEKTGRREPPPLNSAMMRGHELEPMIREKYEKQIADLFLPSVMFHEKYPWMMASLDGINLGADTILEIKTCNRETFETAQSGSVVEHHMIQLQHQLACVPTATSVHYVCYHRDEMVCVVVERDEAMIDRIMTALIEFHDCMVQDTAPAPQTEDYVFIEDPAFDKAIAQYASAKAMYDHAKIQEQACKAALLDFTDDGNCYGNGIKITRCVRESIDYKQACIDAKLDLSAYMKPETSYWRIKLTEQKE